MVGICRWRKDQVTLLLAPGHRIIAEVVRSADFTNVAGLPAVDLLQRSPHEFRSVAVREPIGVAERCNALVVGQHAAGSRPICALHAAVDAEYVDDAQQRFPDVIVWESFAREGAGT
jgi:hypothetical protein